MKTDQCHQCDRTVIVSEERGDFLYCEFFTDKLCFRCYFKRKKEAPNDDEAILNDIDHVLESRAVRREAADL